MGRRLERRRGAPLGWAAALLGVSILTSCFWLTHGIAITLEPPVPILGENITLRPGGHSNFAFCIWNRWHTVERNWIFMYFPPPNPVQENGPRYTGRETAGPNCCLRIQNLKRWDSGRYAIRKMGRDFAPEVGEALLTVTTHKGGDQGVFSWVIFGTLAGMALFVGLLYYSHRQYSRRMIPRVSLLPPASAKKPTVSTGRPKLGRNF